MYVMECKPTENCVFIFRLRPKLRSLVYCNGIRYGGQVEWNFVWGWMQDVTDYWEKTRFGIALTCSVNLSAIKE